MEGWGPLSNADLIRSPECVFSGLQVRLLPMVAKNKRRNKHQGGEDQWSCEGYYQTD